ncbi:MAG: hypothetical protein QXL67_04125, partial [Candidatus Bathyarchaeia archaeon]
MPGSPSPELDREARYQLSEVFKPWSLVKAVEKDTSRHVNITTTTTGISSYTLPDVIYQHQWKEWDSYCSFAERVLVNGTLLIPTGRRIRNDSYWTWWPSFPYTYNISTDGKTINFYRDADGLRSTIGDVTWSVSARTRLKILYSTNDTGRYEWIIVGRDSAAVDSAGAAMI